MPPLAATDLGEAVLGLVLEVVGHDWEGRALCRRDSRLFFGPNSFEPKRERLAREERAKALCRQCPALEACRQYALEHGERFGVWGGLGEQELRGVLDRHPELVRVAS